MTPMILALALMASPGQVDADAAVPAVVGVAAGTPLAIGGAIGVGVAGVTALALASSSTGTVPPEAFMPLVVSAAGSLVVGAVGGLLLAINVPGLHAALGGE